MNTYDLWEKMIKGKVYTKEVAIRRVTAIGPLLSDEEFTALVELINITYPITA